MDTNAENSHDSLTDHDLTAQLMAGNRAPFHVLAARYSPLIRHQALQYSKYTPSLIEDFCQEGYLALYFAALTFEKQKNVKFFTYANRCIQNAMIDLWRSCKKHTSQTVSYHNQPSQATDNVFDSAFFSHSLEQLESYFSQIYQAHFSRLELQVLSRFLTGYSYKEIAQQIGSTEKTVDNALQRVKRKLRPHKT